MTLYEELKIEVDKGLNDEIAYIPFHLDRINKYVDITKNMLYVVGGESGSGKSTITTEAFITEPIRYMLDNPNNGLKLNIKYLSMERKQFMNSAKMAAKHIFENTGYILDVRKLLGRGSKMNEKEQNYFEACEEMFLEYEDFLYVKEGVTKVVELKRLIEKWGKEYGDTVDGFDKEGLPIKVYKPHHPKHIVEIIIDHLGIAGRNKDEMDAISEVVRLGRDFFGFSFIVVVQLNREISSVQRARANTKPKLSDIHGTSTIVHDADNVLLIYDAFRHVTVEDSDTDVREVCGYDLSMLMKGEQKMFRSLHLVKNSFGVDNLSIGLGFMGAIGKTISLKKAAEMTEEDYEAVTDYSAFKKSQAKLF